MDTHEGAAKCLKITHNISGPYRVLGQDRNTIVVQRGEVFERVSRERVTLAPKQAITRVARIGDAQPKHLAAKRTGGRSDTFKRKLGHLELQSGDLISRSRGMAYTRQLGNPAAVSQTKRCRVTSRDTGANLTRASNLRSRAIASTGTNSTRASDRNFPVADANNSDSRKV